MGIALGALVGAYVGAFVGYGHVLYRPHKFAPTTFDGVEVVVSPESNSWPFQPSVSVHDDVEAPHVEHMHTCVMPAVIAIDADGLE